MKKRLIGYAVWLLLACLLYFFENNTGSRILLLCSLAFPLIPAIRRGYWGPDEEKKQPRILRQTIRTFADREEDEPGDLRAFLPGDPVNRIHWKLSAKRDELLVRGQAREKVTEEAEKKAKGTAELPFSRRTKKAGLLFGLLWIALLVILLLLIPSARNGLRALLNRLYDASEAVNAYRYGRFSVPADQSAALALSLMAGIALALLGMTLFSGSRTAALLFMAGCVLFQVYFGLAFPAWGNILLFVLFSFRMLRRPRAKQALLSLLACAAAVTVLVLLIFPGVDAATETASEAVRDRLSQMAQAITGTARELPAGETETRHTHTQSLISGDQEAQPGREYRLETVEEEQISMPHWVSYLRILLLLLLTIAAVILPFLPFVWLSQRRKKALAARTAFASENVSEAVFAIFQQVTAWLEATGNGAGNLPYAQWGPLLSARFSAAYAERFAGCERLFEEAAYSAHEMKEEQRQQAMRLLEETERMLKKKADWKQRLQLRYKECLWG